jgi:DTW domain-containing protein YfiP
MEKELIPATKRPVCAQCERPCRVCWCDALPDPRITIATRIVILQHPDECRRAIRTARMLELGLAHGTVTVYQGRKFPAKDDRELKGHYHEK